MSTQASILPTGTNPDERERLGTPLVDVDLSVSVSNEGVETRFLTVNYGIARIRMVLNERERLELVKALLADGKSTLALPVEYFQFLELKSDKRCTYMTVDENTFQPRRYKPQ